MKVKTTNTRTIYSYYMHYFERNLNNQHLIESGRDIR